MYYILLYPFSYTLSSGPVKDVITICLHYCVEYCDLKYYVKVGHYKLLWLKNMF